MVGIKKIDYRDFVKNNTDNAGIASIGEQKQKKKFCFGNLKEFWNTSDTKVKSELVIFVIVLLLTAGCLVFYGIQKVSEKNNLIKNYENQIIPGLNGK